MTADPNAVAFLSQAIGVVGIQIIVQRNSGVAPNVVTFQASVPAIVRKVVADTTQEAQAGISASQSGVINQDDRTVIIRNDDLTAANYPVPVQKGDWIILPDGDDNFTVTKVDPYFRAIQNAVELTATGVQ